MIPETTFNTFFLQCYNKDCIETRSCLDEKQKEGEFCSHIGPAKEALKNGTFASSVFVNVEELVQKLNDEDVEKKLVENSSEGEIELYKLPGNI